MDRDRDDAPEPTPRWQTPENERQVDADAYHIWTPRPLLRSVYWKPDAEPPREAVGGAYEVFLDQRAFVSMHEHVWGASSDRPFGWLIGDLCEDPSASRRFVIVSGVIPSRFPFPETGPGLPEEAVAALKLEVERRRGVLVGWYHSHAGGNLRLSDFDVAEHERRFPDPWQVAFLFVTDPASPRGACFRATPDGFDGAMPMPFYEMVTNESLLARGVRRSRLDWENFSTLDEVRAEPPPRPRPPDAPATPPGPDGRAGPGTEEAPLVEEAGPEVLPRSKEAAGAPQDQTEGVGSTEPSEVESEPTQAPRAGEPDPFVSSRFDADAETLGTSPAEPAPEPAAEPAPSEPDADDFDAMVADLLGTAAGEEAPGSLPADVVPQGHPAADPGGEAGEEAAAPSGPGEGPLVEAPAPEGEPESPAVDGAGSEAAPDGDDEVRAEEAAGVVLETGVGDERETAAAQAGPPPPVPAAAPERPGRSRRKIAVGAAAIVILGLAALAGMRLVATRVATERAPGPVETPAAEIPTGRLTTRGAEPEVGENASGEEAVGLPERDSVGTVGAEASPAVGEAVAPPLIDRAALEGMSDRVLEAISRYYGRDVARERGEIGCPELQAAFVEVMDSWMDYSTRGKLAWRGRLPEDLAERDERLYRGVQDVERLFGASGCPRP